MRNVSISLAGAPKWGGVYNVPIEQRDAAAQTPSPETAVFPLLETSGPDKFRLQARRLLMRKDIPLDLSSLPVHGMHPGAAQNQVIVGGTP